MNSHVLAAKRLELLRELVPNSGVVGLLVDPNSREASIQLSEVEAAARTVGQQIAVFNAGNEREFDRIFVTLTQQQLGALLVAGSPFFTSQRDKIVALAAHYRIPAIYEWREFTTSSPDHDVSRRGGDVGPHRHLEDQTDHLLFFRHLSSPVANTTLTLLGRFAARAGLVTPRQTFVLRCHGDELHPAKVNPHGSSSDERVLQAPNWRQPGPTTLCPGWPH